LKSQVAAKGKMDQEVTLEKVMLLTDKGYFYLEPSEPIVIPPGSTVTLQFTANVGATPPKREEEASPKKQKSAKPKRSAKPEAPSVT